MKYDIWRIKSKTNGPLKFFATLFLLQNNYHFKISIRNQINNELEYQSETKSTTNKNRKEYQCIIYYYFFSLLYPYLLNFIQLNYFANYSY